VDLLSSGLILGHGKVFPVLLSCSSGHISASAWVFVSVHIYIICLTQDLAVNPHLISFLNTMQNPILSSIITNLIPIITYVTLHILYRSLFNLLRYGITGAVEDETLFGCWDRLLVEIFWIIWDAAQKIYQVILCVLQAITETTTMIIRETTTHHRDPQASNQIPIR